MTSGPASSHTTHEADLLRAWTHHLYREYEFVTFLYGVKLRPAIIRVEPLEARFGTWDSATRTITISRKLISDHPWRVVVEILKHEMAHQLAMELLGARDAHGRVFQQACKMLRVQPWAARASANPTDQPLNPAGHVLTEEQEKLLRRVEKLLSLATSSNEHEALLAMQRVQELYARHNLERLTARGQEDVIQLVLELKRKRIDKLESMICSILGSHFFVRVIFGQQYEAAEDETYRIVELYGTRENVKMAEYVYHFLRNQLQSLWNAYRERTGVMGRSRQDYMLGVLSGFARKLKEGQEEVLKNVSSRPVQESQALMRVGDERVNAYVEELYPRLSTRRWSSGYRDRESFAAGQEEGRKLVLHKGIEDNGGNKGRLLKG